MKILSLEQVTESYKIVKQQQAWFDAVCDDLDPEREYPRPIFAVTTDTSHFDAEDNVMRINAKDAGTLGLSIEEVIAHELRHWFQIHSKMLDKFMMFVACNPIFGTVSARRLVGYWNGEHIDIVTRSADEYHAIPWEVDATEYARDVYSRLTAKAAA